MARASISYRFSLVVVIPLLIVVTGAIIAGNAYLATRRSIDALTAQLFDQVSAQAVDQTRAHVRQAEPAVDLVASSLATAALPADITTDDALARELVSVMRANPGFEWVTFGDEHGGFVGATRRRDELRINRSRVVGGETQVVELVVGDDDVLREAKRDINHYDPRTRPYYKQAVAAGKRVWTAPYIFFDEGVPGITCAAPVVGKDGALRGVVTVDFDLQILSKFVRGLQLSPHSVVFLTDASGDILAHPTLKIVGGGSGSDGKLLTVDSVDDPQLRAFQAGLAGDSDRDGRFDVSFAGDAWIGRSTPFTIDDGSGAQEWRVGALAPASDFDGPLRESTRTAIAISAIAVLIAMALGVYFARVIARPLARIAVEMEKAGGFDITPHAVQTSLFREITAMDRALGQMKSGLGSFAAYVPRDLVRAVLASGTRAELGGRIKTLSVFFSDLAGFTTLSEKLAPDALARLLGTYFDAMTEVIAARGGTIDKFIGDAIMAFWNAPGDEARHAALAVEAALACQARLDELRRTEPGLAHVHARIGVATGDVLVGNIGSHSRMNYTVMGDTANLASRLEGLNKAYGTPVMISDATRAAIGDALIARPIDVVAVKGRSAGVRVYEPLADTADNRAFAAACARALDAYLARDFTSATRAWDDALAVRPGDEACTTMRGRAVEYSVTPPPAEWSGVHVMHEK
jgi:adenylate cyclase|nr:adenylate/guanylate cyclase domain-containing protein [Kofleriaceae bacterium]